MCARVRNGARALKRFRRVTLTLVNTKCSFPENPGAGPTNTKVDISCISPGSPLAPDPLLNDSRRLWNVGTRRGAASRTSRTRGAVTRSPWRRQRLPLRSSGARGGGSSQAPPGVAAVSGHSIWPARQAPHSEPAPHLPVAAGPPSSLLSAGAPRL